MLVEQQKERYKELLQEQTKLHKKVFGAAKAKALIAVFIGIVFGAVLGVALSVYEEQILDKITGNVPIDIYLIAFLGTMFLSAILHILFHEAGHLVFGLLSGYKFLSFRVYSILLYKKDGRLKVGRYPIKGIAGQCLMYPPDKNPDGSYPYIGYNLGGGISNLIFTALGVILFFVTDNSILRLVFMTFAAMGLLIALTNLIPANKGIQNDGMNLKSMLRNRYNRDAFYLQLKVNADFSCGKKITEYPEEVFLVPEDAEETNMLVAFVRFYSYYRLLALQDFKGAKEVLEKMAAIREKYNQANFNLIEMERLFFMLLERKPVEEIACLYKHIKLILQVGKSNISMQRVSYTYEVLLSAEDKKDIEALIVKKSKQGKRKEEKTEDKEKLYLDFLASAQKYPVQGEAELHREIVEYINQTMVYVI